MASSRIEYARSESAMLAACLLPFPLLVDSWGWLALGRRTEQPIGLMISTALRLYVNRRSNCSGQPQDPATRSKPGSCMVSCATFWLHLHQVLHLHAFYCLGGVRWVGGEALQVLSE